MNLQQFIARWNGRFCDFDHAFGAQCVDPADQYLQDVWGMPVFYVTGAVDMFGHRPDLIEWIANDVGNPNQFPQPGDLIIWHLDYKVGTGALGHVDIFVSGNGLAFTGLDQNWPLNSPCHLQAHSYEGVKGWGRLRKVGAPPAPPSPPPPSPPVVVPAPTPTFAPSAWYTFVTDDDLHPVQVFCPLADAMSLADDWSSRHGAQAITVKNWAGDVVYYLAAGVVPARND